MRLTRLLTLAALIPAAGAPAARADAPWSAPVDAGPASVFAADPEIAFGSTGRALVTWRFTESRLRATLNGRLASRAPDGTFGPVQSRPLATAPAVYGRGRAFALLRSGSGARQNLLATYGSTGAGFTGQTRLARRVRLTGDEPALAAGPKGEGAAAWIESRRGRHHLRVSLRGAARGFRKAQTVAQGRFSSPAVAFTPEGTLVIAYQRTERVAGKHKREVVAILKARGEAIPRRARVLGPSVGFSQISVATGTRERVLVAWGTQDVGEEASNPWVVRASVTRASGAFRTQVLDPGGAKLRASGEVRAAVDPDGRAMVAWDNVVRTVEGTTNAVRVAAADDTGEFAAFKQITENGAVGDLAFGRDGTALIVGTVTAGAMSTNRRAFAALKLPETDAFGAPELIDSAGGANPPRAAFDPTSGKPVAVWTAQASADSPYRILVSARA